MMLKILDTLYQIHSLSPKSLSAEERSSKAKELLSQLISFIKQNYGEESAHAVQAAFEVELKRLGDASQAAECKEHSQAADYAGFYTHSLYEQLLPWCQLAYLTEKNGIPEEHAFKLATFFKEYQTALNYLRTFQNFNKKTDYLVHDACLFDLPAAKSCDFKQWQVLAHTNLANPRFRELLPHAAALEEIGRTGNKQKKLPLDRKAIKQKKMELSTVYREEKDMRSSLTQTHQRDEREQRSKKLGEKKAKLRLELAALSQGLPLKEADLYVLESWYKRYQQENNQEAYQLLIKNGISAKHIALFNSLKRANDDNAIPNVLIDGQDLGYPGVYLKKLDTLSDKGAALAACLGKLTGCCQYLGGVGNECTVHGITSPNGGFYVVCQGDGQNPSLDDPIVAQSWVWKGQGGALCLDSIETSSTKSSEQQAIADLFRLLGHRLCQNFGITRVNTGAQSGITRKIALKNYPTQKEHFLDYAGYCDSKAQLPLASQAMPYLFYGHRSKSLSAGPALQKMIAQESYAFFNTLLNTQDAIKDNKALKQALAFALYSKRDALRSLVFLAAAHAHHLKEFVTLLLANQAYQRQLNRKRIDVALIEQGAYVDTQNDEGQNALYLAALQADIKTFDQLMALNPNLNIQDKNGNTALLCMLKQVVYKNNNETERTIALRLIEAGADLDIKDHDENTPLMIAVNNNDLAMVKALVERGADIETFDAQMKTALFLAAETGDAAVFDYLLKRGAKVNIITPLIGNNLLMAAVNSNSQAIIAILLASPSCSPEVLKQQDKYGYNALISAAGNGYTETVQALLASPSCSPEVLRQQDSCGENALIGAARNGHTKVVQAILSSPHCSSEVLRQHDNHNHNVLIWAAGAADTELVQSILASSHCSPEVLRQQSISGSNVLIWAIKNESTETVQAILASPHCIPEVLKQQDENGLNALMWGAKLGHTEVVQAILDSPHCSPEVLRQQDSCGENALIGAARNGHTKVVQAILSSPHCSPEVLSQQSKFNHSALTCAALKGLELVQSILASPHCSPEVLKQQDNNDNNALILAALYGRTEIVQALLASPHCNLDVLTQQDRKVFVAPPIENLIKERIELLQKTEQNKLNHQNAPASLNRNYFFSNAETETKEQTPVAGCSIL